MNWAKRPARVFLAMEFLEGETLRERMARKPLPDDELLDVAVQVAKALEAAHGEGMVHRDIKPDSEIDGLEEGGGAAQSSVTGLTARQLSNLTINYSSGSFPHW
jgi:hypothetical protein